MAFPRNELVEALVASYDALTFDRMLSDHLNLRRPVLVGATGMAGLREIVSAVVEIADERRWVMELVRAAVAANPGSLELQQFLVRNPACDPAQQAQPQTYFLSVFMRGRRVFWKREQLRMKLQEIGGPNESRVLAIDGDRKTGKTYSRDFVNFLRENEPGWAGKQHMIYLNTDERVFQPEELTLAIGRRLGLEASTMPPDKGEQAPRRVPALLEWLSTGLEASKTDVWWLILDGFRDQVQPSATHDLIRAMIDAVERDQSNVRMILINYKAFLDIDIGTFILHEEIEPIDEERDLPQFFRYVYTLSRKQFAESDITETVASVRRQVDAEVARRGADARLMLLSVGMTNAANQLLR